MNSPLGKYSQLVAAVVAITIIISYIAAVVFQHFLAIDLTQVENLKILALIAVGAVFGSAATINGVKAPLDSAHSRIDKLELGTKIPTHGTYPPVPGEPTEGTPNA